MDVNVPDFCTSSPPHEKTIGIRETYIHIGICKEESDAIFWFNTTRRLTRFSFQGAGSGGPWVCCQTPRSELWDDDR